MMNQNLINNNFLDWYKEEISLILKYNPIEYEMYSCISYILRSIGDISLRDVHKCDSRTNYTKRFMSIKGTPDFAIMSRDINNDNVYGVVEIKLPTKTYIQGRLDYWKNIQQVKAQLNKFKNVIYTNGIEWRFYNLDSYQQTDRPIKKFKLGDIVDNENVKWNKDNTEWHALLLYMSKFIEKLLCN